MQQLPDHRIREPLRLDKTYKVIQSTYNLNEAFFWSHFQQYFQNAAFFLSRHHVMDPKDRNNPHFFKQANPQVNCCSAGLILWMRWRQREFSSTSRRKSAAPDLLISPDLGASAVQSGKTEEGPWDHSAAVGMPQLV